MKYIIRFSILFIFWSDWIRSVQNCQYNQICNFYQFHLFQFSKSSIHIKFLRYRIFSSCMMHKKNYVHLILQIRSKANDVIKIAWTLSGFNFSAIGSLWRPLEAVLQPRHSDSVASPAKPRPLEAFKGQRWLKNWNHLKFRLFWSQY